MPHQKICTEESKPAVESLLGMLVTRSGVVCASGPAAQRRAQAPYPRGLVYGVVFCDAHCCVCSKLHVT
jgi:hypothetical protein